MKQADLKVTLADVARRANVSITSVSRVINNNAPVNSLTRARIESAMAELGYTAPAAAQRRSETTIAVLTGDLHNPYFPEIIHGMQEEADNYGMLTAIIPTSDSPQRQQHIARQLSKRVANALILLGSTFYPDIEKQQSRLKLPMVVINRQVSGPALGSIWVDFKYAGYRAAQHLLLLGHTRIAFIANFRANEPFSSARRDGVLQAVSDAGLSVRPEWLQECPPGSGMDGGFHAMNALLSLPPARRPSGVVCFNDIIAVGAEHAVRAAGLRVPEDISVVGFDDLEVAAHCCPPLTTISQAKHRIGAMAVQMLRKMILDPTAVGDSLQVESPLVVRESTGPYVELRAR